MNSLEKRIHGYVSKAHHPQLYNVLVWEKGEIVAECYFNGSESCDRHNIKSVMKSILSVAIGIAQDEGLLDIDDSIGKYIPEFHEKKDPRHANIKIKHLLTMSSGIFWQGGVHYHCPMMDTMRRSGEWIKFIADIPVKERPGSRHNYKEWDVILLSKILSVVSGDCYDYIDNRIYKPLGITSDRWIKSPDGVYYSPAYEKEKEKVSDLTARDMLKIGLLFLRNGMWNGKRILSSEYIREATAPSPTDAGYGFLWWRGKDWYGCRGFGGQTVTVFPDKEKIVVTQAKATNRPLTYDDVIFSEWND